MNNDIDYELWNSKVSFSSEYTKLTSCRFDKHPHRRITYGPFAFVTYCVQFKFCCLTAYRYNRNLVSRVYICNI